MFKTVATAMILTLLSFAEVPVLKTGQVKSYDAEGNIIANDSARDDGHYRAGKARSYSRNGDVVTDNVTGLEWQDDVDSVQKPWVTQANYDAGNYDDTSGDTATTYCSDLSLDDGGWRLPTIEELETLRDLGRYNPAVTEGVFQHISSDYYWSSTTNANYTSLAWFVVFNYGYSNYYSKGSSNYVRCVRGGQFDDWACPDPEREQKKQGERVCIPGTTAPNPGLWLPLHHDSERLIQGTDKYDDTAIPENPPGLFLPSCPEGKRLIQGTDSCQ